MNKTKAQKYNERMEKILNPEIERLKKREEISKKILSILNEKTNIDYCGLEECHLINAIGKEIDQFIK